MATKPSIFQKLLGRREEPVVTKEAVDLRIEEGLSDIKQGRVDGPYDDSLSFIEALHADAENLDR